MDSNKDFIHIDELFKKMQNEPVTSYKNTDSAWEKMRAQLDKEMPTGGLTANGSSKRRYFYPLLALLLASSAGSFGYWFYLKSDKSTITASENNIQKVEMAKQANISQSAVAFNDKKIESEHATNASINNNANGTYIRKSSTNTTNNKGEKAEHHSEYVAVSKNKINAHVNHIVTNRPELANNPDQDQLIVAQNNIENKLQQGPASPAAEVKINLDSNDNLAQNDNNVTYAIKTGIEEKEVIATSIVNHENGNTYLKTEDGNWYEKSEKTVQIQHYKLANNNIEKIAGPTEIKTINELKPVADPTSIELEPSIANEAHDLGVKKEDIQLTKDRNRANNNFFTAVVKKSDDFAKLFINSPTFSAIMNFGINYTAIGGGSVGFQFGVGSMYHLGERLSLGLELKYVNNQFFQYQYQDNSKLYNVEQSGSIYTGTETIENNSYTFNSINRLQVPLYLNYYFTDKMALIGGVSLNYAAPIKYKVATEKFVNNQYVSLQMPQQNPLQINTNNDFKSNIGMGYVIGLGVDINKNWNIDFRVSQNFMHNSKSNNKFIHSLYQNPNFQLNMVFNIGKKKKEMLLMDPRN